MSGRGKEGDHSYSADDEQRRQQELEEIMEEVWQKKERTAWMKAEVEEMKWRIAEYEAKKWKLLWGDGICKHDAKAMDKITDDGEFETLKKRYEAGVKAGRWGCGCGDSKP